MRGEKKIQKKRSGSETSRRFQTSRLEDAAAAGCGATRLLELMNEESNWRNVSAGLVAAQNFPNRRVAPHPIFYFLFSTQEARNPGWVSHPDPFLSGSAIFDFRNLIDMGCES